MFAGNGVGKAIKSIPDGRGVEQNWLRVASARKYLNQDRVTRLNQIVYAAGLPNLGAPGRKWRAVRQ